MSVLTPLILLTILVFNKMDKFEGTGSADGWVSVVIRNNILDEDEWFYNYQLIWDRQHP